MQHMKEKFDDNCNELMTLRWFRDNFVNEDDIKHYYSIAPIIVKEIDSISNSNKIYNWIYENVVLPCVTTIQENKYEFAYTRCKSSVILLEEKFAKPMLQNQLVNTLKRIR